MKSLKNTKKYPKTVPLYEMGVVTLRFYQIACTNLELIVKLLNNNTMYMQYNPSSSFHQ